jgi:uncharacterized membrane protein HdeD (DUF308 family)
MKGGRALGLMVGVAAIAAPFLHSATDLQTLGTALRNAGLVSMGYAVLARARRRSANEPS